MTNNHRDQAVVALHHAREALSWHHPCEHVRSPSHSLGCEHLLPLGPRRNDSKVNYWPISVEIAGFCCLCSLKILSFLWYAPIHNGDVPSYPGSALVGVVPVGAVLAFRADIKSTEGNHVAESVRRILQTAEIPPMLCDWWSRICLLQPTRQRAGQWAWIDRQLDWD